MIPVPLTSQAGRQVVTDRQAEIDSVMRTSVVHPSCLTISNDLMPHLYI